MPIRRPRGPKPTLRHVAFLEAMTRAESKEEMRRELAAFATLRLLEHWIQLGSDLAAPDFLAHAVARRSVRLLDRADPLRGLLEQVLRAITMLVEPDAHAVGSRLVTLGEHFESSGRFAEAADAYSTAERMSDPSVQSSWAFRAHLRHGYCLLVLGDHEQAASAMQRAGMRAGMHRDRWGQLVARVGAAKVELARGDIKGSDRSMREVAAQCERLVASERAPKPRSPNARARHHR